MSTSHNIIEKIKNDLRYIVLEPNLCLFSDAYKPHTYFAGLKEDLEKSISKIPEGGFYKILKEYAHHYRLGIYAENLLGLYFRNSDRFHLIEKNTQVIKDKKTLGEIDFIVFDHDEKKLKHIELGCKFYIQMGKEINQWVGPNPKDNLAKKSNKLIKQLDLSKIDHPILIDIKDKYGLDFQREAWIKGRLFGHNEDLPPESAHISCGKVFFRTEIAQDWVPIQKIFWLSNAKENNPSTSSRWDDAQMLMKTNGEKRAFYLSKKWLSNYQHSIL